MSTTTTLVLMVILVSPDAPATNSAIEVAQASSWDDKTRVAPKDPAPLIDPYSATPSPLVDPYASTREVRDLSNERAEVEVRLKAELALQSAKATCNIDDIGTAEHSIRFARDFDCRVDDLERTLSSLLEAVAQIHTAEAQRLIEEGSTQAAQDEQLIAKSLRTTRIRLTVGLQEGRSAERLRASGGPHDSRQAVRSEEHLADAAALTENDRVEVERIAKVCAARKASLEADEKQLHQRNAAEAEEARATAEQLLASGDGAGALEQSRRAEALGLNVRELVVRAQARVDTQTKEREAAWAALWGPFREWRKRPKNRAVVAAIRHRLLQEDLRKKLSDQHDEEKQSNDEKTRDPEIYSEAIFPQSSGAFTFLKILDRGNSEALFEANDGLFVLRLSPGDSFGAYQGQNVNVTMHTRGETMLMTSGRRLPVFWSGASPARTRRLAGFRPNRTKESQLAASIRALDAALARDRKAALKPIPDSKGEALISAQPIMKVTFFIDEDSTDRVLVEDVASHRTAYCIGPGACPAEAQSIDSAEVLAPK